MICGAIRGCKCTTERSNTSHPSWLRNKPDRSSAAQQTLSPPAYAWRDSRVGDCFAPPRGNRGRYLSEGGKALHQERQRRAKTKGEQIVTRRSYQQGHISQPVRTRQGSVTGCATLKASGLTSPKPSTAWPAKRPLAPSWTNEFGNPKTRPSKSRILQF